MRFSTQRLAGLGESRGEEDLAFSPEAADVEQEETGDMQHLDGTDIQPTDTEENDAKQDQTTLADILKAVNKCTGSVYTLKEQQFGGWKDSGPH